MKTKTPKARLISDEGVQIALSAARLAQEAWQAKHHELEHLTDPVAYAKAHQRYIAGAKSAEAIEFAVNRLGAATIGGLNDWRAPHPSQAASAARSRAAALVNETFPLFKSKVVALTQAANAVLAELRAEAQDGEAEFHATWGLPVEPTGVTRRLKSIESTLAGFTAGLSEEQSIVTGTASPLPQNALDHILAWFSAE